MAYPGRINPRHHPNDDEITLAFKRPCVCAEGGTGGFVEKNCLFAEGTQTDQKTSSSLPLLCENVWLGIRPPRLFGKQAIPEVTARQIYITRVILAGKLQVLEEEEDMPPIKKDEPTFKNVSISIKKSAAKFLGRPEIDFDFN